jgi:hypothetical protein
MSKLSSIKQRLSEVEDSLQDDIDLCCHQKKNGKLNGELNNKGLFVCDNCDTMFSLDTIDVKNELDPALLVLTNIVNQIKCATEDEGNDKKTIRMLAQYLKMSRMIRKIYIRLLNSNTKSKNKNKNKGY